MLFNVVRARLDLLFGHECQARVQSNPPLVNQGFVFDTNLPILTEFDTFIFHGCKGADGHIPYVTRTACSTKVFVKNLPVALTNRQISCLDIIQTFPAKPSKVFVGL